jgi:hypothetical protein
MVTGLSKPNDHCEPFEFESDNETAEVEIDLQGNEFKNKLQITIYSLELSKNELAILEVKSKSGPNLPNHL